VVNPLDYTDLTGMTDILRRKIARPMVHASYDIGSFAKIEGVFLPWFEGHRFARSGRWAPRELAEAAGLIEQAVIAGIGAAGFSPQENKEILAYYAGLSEAGFYPATEGMEYAQAGARFTAAAGSSDIGFQYFFGNLFRPGITVGGADTFAQNPYGVKPDVRFNRYHHIGADFARVVMGFNLRAELAANITGDLSGSDGAVYNPAVWWSLGFDRPLRFGALTLFDLNIQVTEGIRIWYNRIDDRPGFDTEAGAGATSTRMTLILSRTFLRDELEVKVTGIWGIEDNDFFIIPSVSWTQGDLSAELSAGFLGGDARGELGQYRKNSFLKLGLTYHF
jgi:hypothetical protein